MTADPLGWSGVPSRGAPLRSSVGSRLAAPARALRRRAFCLSLALDLSRGVQRDEPVAAVRLALRIPFAHVLRRVVRHRPGTVAVPVASILMGSQARLDAVGFAEAMGTLRYGSTPMAQSPHVAVLREAMAQVGALDDDALRATAYFAFARRMAEIWGDYFGARTDAELLAVTRNFVEWALEDAPRVTAHSGSRVGDDVLVARVAGTRAYHVIDGHHRVAAAIAHGATHLEVRRTWLPAESPLRTRLAARAGRGGRPVLDQPLATRDLDDAAVTTNCEGRLVRMARALDGHVDAACPPRFLQLGCGSGWYLAELKRRGWSVLGVERDPFLVELATTFRDLTDQEVVLGEPAELADRVGGPYDAIACLGLGTMARDARTRDEAARLAGAVDRLGARALFCDDPSGRTADGDLAALVLANTGLTTIADLGSTDDPGRSPAAGPSTRLLAFLRSPERGPAG